jgi:hypothetical protein
LELIKRLFEKRICQVHVSQVAFNRLPEGRVHSIPLSFLGVRAETCKVGATPNAGTSQLGNFAKLAR